MTITCVYKIVTVCLILTTITCVYKIVTICLKLMTIITCVYKIVTVCLILTTIITCVYIIVTVCLILTTIITCVYKIYNNLNIDINKIRWKIFMKMIYISISIFVCTTKPTRFPEFFEVNIFKLWPKGLPIMQRLPVET